MSVIWLHLEGFLICDTRGHGRQMIYDRVYSRLPKVSMDYEEK